MKEKCIKMLVMLAALTMFISGCKKEEQGSEVGTYVEVIDETSEAITDIMESTSDAISEIQESYDQIEDSVASDDISYSAWLPDPSVIFPNSEITIDDADGGDYYIFRVKNYTIEEFQLFVSELKRLGWCDSVYDVEDAYGAYSSDGLYWVEASIGADDILYVVCQTRRSE